MELEFKKAFLKRAKALPEGYQEELKEITEKLAKAKTINDTDLDIVNIKDKYYRIRMGKYRIGIEVIESCIFWVIMSRGDIYKHFPPK